MSPTVAQRALLLAAAAFLATSPASAQDLVVGGERIAEAGAIEAARKEGPLLIFGAYPETGMDPIRAAFTKATGIPTQYVRLITQRMHPRVTAEHAAGKLEADLVDMSDLALVQDLVERRILSRPHKVPSFDRLAPALRDAAGRWYTYLRPCSAIVVNTARAKDLPLPVSWLDALDERWKGSIGMPSIDAGGSAFSNYMFLRDRVAPDYWQRLAALKPRVYPSLLPAANDVARGENMMMIGGPEPLYEQMRAGAPLKVVFPKEGIACFPSAGGITAGSKRPNAAAVWLNWITSKAGGDVVATTGAYASHPDASPPKPAGIDFPPQARVWNIEQADWAAKRDRYSSEWRTTFGVK